jgi:hypothetical protein
MFRHTVLFRWKAEAAPEQKEETVSQLALLPSLVPSLRAFASRADAGLNEGNYDFAVTADFDDLAGYLTYRDDPRHREIVTKYVEPILADRAVIQYSF